MATPQTSAQGLGAWTAGMEAGSWLQRQLAAGAGFLVAANPPPRLGRPPASCHEPLQQPSAQGEWLTAAQVLPLIADRVAASRKVHG